MLRQLAPIAAAIALVLVIAGDSSELDDDLQLAVPRLLARDSPYVPLRARFYTQLRAAEGPLLVREPVAVSLETSTGHVLTTGRLSPARGSLLDVEGNLPLPDTVAWGAGLQIVARARHSNHALQVHAQLTLSDAIDTPAPQGRSLRGLQQFSAGPVQALEGMTAPAALNVQVRGGACVPEEPCRLAVHIGEPAAGLRVEPNSTLTLSSDAVQDSAVTAEVVPLEITTHGPEAELWLVAVRAGRRVARRAVRLPIALAALAVETSAIVVERASELRMRARAADSGCIVDAFQNGQWRATGSLAACAQDSSLPFALTPGLWRLQLRRDPFSAETAGVAIVYLQRTAETPTQVVSALAAAALQAAPDDWFVQRCAAQPGTCAAASSLSYLAAVLEVGLLPLPQPVTGYADALERTRERQAYMRTLALLSLVLGGLGLALSVGRSGVGAGMRASQLLSEDPRRARRVRWRSLALVAASVGSLILVFVVLALYVLARGGY